VPWQGSAWSAADCFDPKPASAAQLTGYLDFTRQNAYYTAEVVITMPNSAQETAGKRSPHTPVPYGN